MSEGFAIAFWNIIAEQISNLEEIISHWGNGIGYGVYQPQPETTGCKRPEAFIIEFDTYYNYCRSINDEGDSYQDPTDQDHVVITYDGYWRFPHHYENDEGELVEVRAGRVMTMDKPIPLAAI